jgi:hypothetical protein
VRIRERPQRRLEADGANRTRQLARPLEAVAIDQGDIGTDCGVFRHVPIEGITYLDLEVLSGDMIEKLLGLGVVAVDDRDHSEQLVEGNRNRGSLHVARDHLSLPRVTQSTR